MGEREEETRDAELVSPFIEVSQRKDEMDRAQVAWRKAAENVIGAGWFDEFEARQAHAAKDVTRILAALRTALEGLGEIGQGTADVNGYDHALARLARATLATIERIGEGGDGA